MVSGDENRLFTLLQSGFLGSISIDNPAFVEIGSIANCNCFCLLPNESEFVVAQQSVISLWKKSSTDCLRYFRGHTMPVLSLGCSGDGSLLVSGSADESVRVWDMLRGFCTHCFKDGDGIVRSVEFFPDKMMVVSIHANNTIAVHDLHLKQTVKKFTCHTASPSKVAVHAPTNSMISSGRDKV